MVSGILTVVAETASDQKTTPIDYVVGILVIAAIVGFFIWLGKRSNKKRSAQTWTGTVVKKWLATYSDEDGEVTKAPTIQVQIDGGKKKKYAVKADTYNALSEGDKVKKEAGQMDPVKV